MHGIRNSLYAKNKNIFRMKIQAHALITLLIESTLQAHDV